MISPLQHFIHRFILCTLYLWGRGVIFNLSCFRLDSWKKWQCRTNKCYWSLPQWNSESLTYLLTYSMVQSPSWAADWLAASQEIPRISRNPKVHYRTHKRPPQASDIQHKNWIRIFRFSRHFCLSVECLCTFFDRDHFYLYERSFF